MANAESHPELQLEIKIVNFVKVIVLPMSLNEINSDSIHLTIWNYPPVVNGRDMNIHVKD
jgi:hypothetical protein